jgi:hypothetical protein
LYSEYIMCSGKIGGCVRIQNTGGWVGHNGVGSREMEELSPR